MSDRKSTNLRIERDCDCSINDYHIRSFEVPGVIYIEEDKVFWKCESCGRERNLPVLYRCDSAQEDVSLVLPVNPMKIYYLVEGSCIIEESQLVLGFIPDERRTVYQWIGNDQRLNISEWDPNWTLLKVRMARCSLCGLQIPEWERRPTTKNPLQKEISKERIAHCPLCSTITTSRGLFIHR